MRLLVRARFVAVAAALAAVLACDSARPAQPHDVLGASAEPLRAQFNRDVGHVRVLMVVAPT